MASNQAHNRTDNVSGHSSKALMEPDRAENTDFPPLVHLDSKALENSKGAAFPENPYERKIDPSNPVHALQDQLEARVDGQGKKTSIGDVTDATRLSAPGFTEKKRTREYLSRAATLHLIDRLAKLGPSAILIMMSGAFYFAVSFFVVAPIETTLWAAMVLLSGGRLLLHNRAFLAGDKKIASRQLRFRAYHTVSLLVFSTAIAAVLPLLGGYADQLGQTQLMVNVILFVAVIGGGLQLPHARASLAILIPIVISVVCFGGQNVQLSSSLIFIASLAGGAIVALFTLTGRLLMTRARRKYPRTVYRSQFERQVRLHFRRKALQPMTTSRRMVHQKSASIV